MVSIREISQQLSNICLTCRQVLSCNLANMIAKRAILKTCIYAYLFQKGH